MWGFRNQIRKTNILGFYIWIVNKCFDAGGYCKEWLLQVNKKKFNQQTTICWDDRSGLKLSFFITGVIFIQNRCIPFRVNMFLRAKEEWNEGVTLDWHKNNTFGVNYKILRALFRWVSSTWAGPFSKAHGVCEWSDNNVWKNPFWFCRLDDMIATFLCTNLTNIDSGRST